MKPQYICDRLATCDECGAPVPFCEIKIYEDKDFEAMTGQKRVVKLCSICFGKKK